MFYFDFKVRMKFTLTLSHGLLYAYVLHFKISLKISETITPRKLMFCKNVPRVGLIKFCSQNARIPYIFWTGIGKLEKMAKSLKNLLQNRKCQRWTKSSFIISKKSFLKLVRGNFLWPIFYFIGKISIDRGV
jgi:hypothetical protein